eukprot:1445258-Rhodomonas_salina.1
MFVVGNCQTQHSLIESRQHSCLKPGFDTSSSTSHNKHHATGLVSSLQAVQDQTSSDTTSVFQIGLAPS